MTDKQEKVKHLPLRAFSTNAGKSVCRLHKKGNVYKRHEKKVCQHLDEIGKILYDMGKEASKGLSSMENHIHISCFVLPGYYSPFYLERIKPSKGVRNQSVLCGCFFSKAAAFVRGFPPAGVRHRL